MHVKELCNLRRSLSLLLVMALAFGMIPAYAAETSPLSLHVSQEGPYAVGEEVAVNVIAPEGAALYYTLTGDAPSETSEKVTDGTILVSADEPGTVEVKVLAVVEAGTNPEVSTEPEDVVPPVEDVVPDEDLSEQKQDAEQSTQNPGEDNNQSSGGERAGEGTTEDNSEASGNGQGNDNQEAEEEDNQTSVGDQDGQASGNEEPRSPVEEQDNQNSGGGDSQDSDEEQADKNPGENSDQSPDKDQDDQVANDDGGQPSDEGQGKQENQASDAGSVPPTSKNQNTQEVSDEKKDESPVENVLTKTSLFRSAGVGVISAATPLSAFLLDGEGDASRGESDIEIVKEYYNASLSLTFEEIPNVVSMAEDGTPIAPELAIESEKRIYSLSEAANVIVTLPEGITEAYYTTDGSEPTSSDEKVNEGKITVKAPNSEDGGAVTVKVVSAITNEGNTIYSAAPSEVVVSFYDNTPDDEDECSVSIGTDAVYYFAKVANAFAAVDEDANIYEQPDDIVFCILKDETTYEINDTVLLFRDAVGKITLDLSGHNFTVKYTGAATTAKYFRPSTPNFILTDSKCSSEAITTGLEKNESFSAATLTFENAYFNLNQDAFIISNLKINIRGKYLVSGLSASNYGGTISNCQISFNTERNANSNAVLIGSTKVNTSVSNTYIENSSTPTGSTYSAGGIKLKGALITDFTDNIVISQNGNTFEMLTSPKFTINGGKYTGKTVIKTATNAEVTIESGVFSGDINASASNSSVIIHGGYIKGEFVGSVYTVNCQGTLIEDQSSPYYGYTYYQEVEPVTATINVVDATSGNEIDAAAVSAEVNELPVENLAIATPGQTIAYTITCLPDYKVYGIAVNDSDITLDSDENYEVNEDGSVATYHYTVPTSDFTLTFKIGLTEEAQAGDDVVTVSNSGSETAYKSLSSAMGFLKDGDTLTLTTGKEIIYSDILVFDKDNITLDLNGATLVMAADPLTNVTSDTYNILLSGGDLEIKDSSSDESGVLTFNDQSDSIRMMNGIMVTGEGTKLSLTGGTITGLYVSSFVSSIVCSAENGTVSLSGGRIEGSVNMKGTNAELLISDDAEIVVMGIPNAVSVTGSAKATISGGTIRSGENVESTSSVVGINNSDASSSSEHVSLEMTGGKIICDNDSSAIRVSGIYGKVQLSGGDVISDGAALEVYGSDSVQNSCVITIEDEIKLKGETNAVLIEDKKYLPIIEINGGFFSCGDGSIPISDTYFVTYPNTNSTDNIPDKVLNLLKNKDSAGYVSLVDPDSLKGTYTPSEGTGIEQTLEYTYQDFEGASDGSNSGLKQLLEATKTIYDAGNSEGSYPGDAWSAFTSAYELAKRLYDSNRNANQDEIDYRAAALSKAMIDLNASTDIVPSTMADGYYYIDVGLWKSDMTTPSMSNGALDSTAILSKAGSEYTLSLNFGPTYQYTVYGHLLDFFIYNGEDVNEAKVNMQRDTEDGKDTSLATEASYSNWYAGSSTSAQKTLASEVLGEDIRTDKYNLPGTVTVTLPYIGTTDDLRSYWVGMNVDAMGGYASAILMLSWGTLEAVPESEIEDALYLSSTSVNLSLYADGVRTAEVTANVLGSSGWTISCDEKIEDGQTAAGVATASVTGNTITFTAVKEGTSTFVVTASKDGADPLTKEITVTVTNDAPFAADVNVSGSTARVDISGASLSGANEGITSTSSRITIDATSSNSQVSQAVITIDANTMTALLSALDRLGSTSPSLRFETDVGQLTLDYDVVENAAGYGQDITLEIGEIDIPDIDGLSDGDFETAYELAMSYGSRNISSLGGEVTISVPWDEDVGYAYYVDGDELAERYAMTVSGGSATWITDHFSTWALSTDRNLMEVGITEGVYSVPIVIKQADAPSRDSMANDAVGDMVVADVDEDGVTYTMFLKARIGDELGGEPLRGHLLKMWYYAPDDTSRSNPIRATVVRTYEDRDMNGDMDTFPREVEVYQEGEPNEDYYIQVSVDAMGGDSALQDALVRLDWDNALDDGGDAAREGFVDEYATEQVIDSGDSVSRSDLSDWIDEEYTLLVQGDDTYLTARFDTDALEDLYDQTSSSIKFVLDEVKKSNLTDEQQEVAGDRPVYQLKITSGSKTITEIDDGTAEVTLPYELQDDENKDGLVIWLVDEDGGIQSIKFSYNSSREYVSFDTTEFGVFVIGYDAEQIWENPFTDVSEDDWFYDAVKYVVQKEMFAGTSETTFEPNLTMSRAMLVTVLYRMDGTPEVSGSSKFADVLDGQYYTDAVLWATENGIVAGYDNGLFGTNDIVSRQQMATFLYRYAQYKGYDVSLVKGLENYTDSSTVASYAIRPMQWAVANGLINGTSATTLTPTGGATRAQVAVILMRFDEAIVIPAQEKAAEETEG